MPGVTNSDSDDSLLGATVCLMDGRTQDSAKAESKAKAKQSFIRLFKAFKRRRTSQGSGPTKTGKSYIIPAGSKTKSVDVHGYINPLDWDRLSLKSKSHTMDSPGSTAISNNSLVNLRSPSDPSMDKINDALDSQNRKQHTKTVSKPAGTLAYTVKTADTLAGIAARFRTTPSELVKINRLVSRLIFPGQVLYVPRTSSEDDDSSSNESGKFSESSPKVPGRAERITSPPLSPTSNMSSSLPTLPTSERKNTAQYLSEDEERKLDKDCIEKFLKINVRHITDGQGVVSGVLLVTPNAVMFDPSVVDPLVVEHGPDKYGVIAPMDYVVNAGLYKDIAHMRVGHHAPQPNLPEPEIYHAKSCPLFKSQCSRTGSSDTEGMMTVPGVPPRSESQQAVKGSVSDDKADDLSDGEESASVCSCHTANKGSEAQTPEDKSSSSEVFVPESGIKNKDKAGGDVAISRDTIVIVKDTDSGEGKGETVIAEIHNDTVEDISDNEEIHKSPKYIDAPKSSILPLISDGLTLLKSPESGGSKVLPQRANSSSLLIGGDAAHQQQHGESELSKGPSAAEGQLSVPHETTKQKVFKRLSYPLSWMDSLSGTEKEDSSFRTSSSGSLDSAASTEKTNTNSPLSLGIDGQSALSKIISTPKNLVDFSSGLFSRSSDVQDVAALGKPASPGPNTADLDEFVVVDSKGLFSSLDDDDLQGSRRQSASAALANRFAEARNPALHNPGTTRHDSAPRVAFKSEVSIDDKKDLFLSMDQLLPRPAKAPDDPPLYLCLRMGKPLNKKLPRTTPIMSYGHQRMKREYWFSIPRDRCDGLYNFFQQWAPGIYGEMNEEQCAERGFQLISSDEDLSAPESDEEDSHRGSGSVGSGSSGENEKKRHSGGGVFPLQRRRKSKDDRLNDSGHTDWEIIRAPYLKLFGRLRRDTQTTLDSSGEVVSMTDSHDLTLGQISFEDLPIPELLGKTDILEEDHRRELCQHLPARAEGYAWSLIYSTSEHGSSLNTLYRRMAHFQTPILLVIKDTFNTIFGALTSCPLKVSDHFYGTGESFLFTFKSDFRVFNWSGENEYFIKGNPDSLAIGSSSGFFGLWLDGDLYHGRSQSCRTYRNDMLSSETDFCVKTLEAWGFVEFSHDASC